jgi:glutamine amidotransferase
MDRRVTVVDYGIGNIFSVTRALEQCGAEVTLSGDPQQILASPRVVLPGVGAFSKGMEGLAARGLIEPLRTYAGSGRPLLGICLGMQMLFTTSNEFGSHQGLGIIEGTIEAIKAPRDAQGELMKVPHIGWSALQMPPACSSWEGTILRHVAPGEHCYFVHSFTAVPASEQHRLADTAYGDCRVSAAVRKGNIYGCQFHPEKSGPSGLKIVQGFLEI